MASKSERVGPGVGLAATALAALGWWFGSGLQPHWWLAWLAPLPILWLAPRVRAHWAALAAFAAYAIGGLNLWGYLHEHIHLPMPVIVYVIAMPALVLALCVLLFRRLVLRGHTFAAALALPAAWVALEYVNSLASPHGTYGSIAYTQMEALPVIQVAAVAGIWGVAFLLLLLPSAVAIQMLPRVTQRSRWSVAAVALVLIGSALAYGAWRLQVPASATLRVGLVSLQNPVKPALDEAEGHALLTRYVEAIDRLADAGARIALLPEASFASAGATVPALAQAAARRGLGVAVGVASSSDPQAERNQLLMFQPGVAAPATYNKHHLIPGFEDNYTPGDAYTLLDGVPRIGLAICKDMDFQDIGRAYGVRDAQLLLVPAWDFNVDGWLHGRMAIMRGVESGFAIARTARSGRLTLSDDRGRVVAEASSEQHDAELVGDVPLRQTRTLYTRWGDWFAWVGLLVLALCLVLACLPRRTKS